MRNVYVVTLIILFTIGMAGFMTSCGQQETDNQAGVANDSNLIDDRTVDLDQVEMLYYDVNYSQCWKHQGRFSTTGVEVLLLIRNDSDSAIDEYSFRYVIDTDDIVVNLDDPEEPFIADGYIAPHSLGYMFARIHIPDDTDHDQGEIMAVAVKSCEEKKGSTFPRVSDVQWYDYVYEENQYGEGDRLFDITEWNLNCVLTNPGDEIISKENTIMLAAPDLEKMDPENGAPIFGMWACGKLVKDVTPHEETVVVKGLDKPQFDIGIEDFSQQDLNVYVLETGNSKSAQGKQMYDVPAGAKRIVAKAKELAWPYGTDESVYKYDGGSPTEAYEEAIDIAYPDRSDWGKQPRSGASCDVFVGTVIRTAGYDSEFPRGLDEVEEHIEKNAKLWKKYNDISAESELQPGDVIYQRWEADGTKYGHIMVYLGDGKVANAHYGRGGRFGVIELARDQIKSNTDTQKVKKRYVYRPTK